MPLRRCCLYAVYYAPAQTPEEDLLQCSRPLLAWPPPLACRYWLAQLTGAGLAAGLAVFVYGRGPYLLDEEVGCGFGGGVLACERCRNERL